MKWKTALTAEEAALMSTQLHKIGWQVCQTLEDVEYYRDELERRIGDKGSFRDDNGFIADTPEQERLDQISDSLAEAVEIKEGLEREIHVAWLRLGLGGNKDKDKDCTLVLVNWFDSLERINDFMVTKISLAEWFYKMGDIGKAKIFDPNNLSAIKSFSTKEFVASSYPKKLQLAIDAHKYFWAKENAGDQRSNSDVETWLHEEAIRLEIKHVDDGKPMPSISNKVKEVITQIIKPD